MSLSFSCKRQLQNIAVTRILSFKYLEPPELTDLKRVMCHSTTNAKLSGIYKVSNNKLYSVILEFKLLNSTFQKCRLFFRYFNQALKLVIFGSFILLRNSIATAGLAVH